MKKIKANAYDVITAKVIAQLESAEAGQWQKGWVSAAGGLATSMSTGKAYRGINQLVLMWAGLPDRRWGTYKAWQDVGAQVPRGAAGTAVLFFSTFDKKDKAGLKTGETGAFAKISYVWNASQVENAPALPVVETPNLAQRNAAVDEFIANTGADIRHGQAGAFYKPTADWIGMPDRDLFVDTETSSATEGYYSTLLHELAHWTGHRSRLDRVFEGSKRFGGEAYAFEELVAELASVFACAEMGVEAEPRADHAQYLASWLKVLKSDNRAIVTAAKHAQAAVEHLQSLQEPEVSEAA